MTWKGRPQEGNQRAQLALDSFEYSVKKLIGSYAAAMGGVDAIIFTAGVGENGADTRANVVSGLEFMGVKLDEEKNNTRGKEVDVATDDSKVRVLVIPTNDLAEVQAAQRAGNHSARRPQGVGQAVAQLVGKNHNLLVDTQHLAQGLRMGIIMTALPEPETTKKFRAVTKM